MPPQSRARIRGNPNRGAQTAAIMGLVQAAFGAPSLQTHFTPEMTNEAVSNSIGPVTASAEYTTGPEFSASVSKPGVDRWLHGGETQARADDLNAQWNLTQAQANADISKEKQLLPLRTKSSIDEYAGRASVDLEMMPKKAAIENDAKFQSMFQQMFSKPYAQATDEEKQFAVKTARTAMNMQNATNKEESVRATNSTAAMREKSPFVAEFARNDINNSIQDQLLTAQKTQRELDNFESNSAKMRQLDITNAQLAQQQAINQLELLPLQQQLAAEQLRGAAEVAPIQSRLTPMTAPAYVTPKGQINVNPAYEYRGAVDPQKQAAADFLNRITNGGNTPGSTPVGQQPAISTRANKKLKRVMHPQTGEWFTVEVPE